LVTMFCSVYVLKTAHAWRALFLLVRDETFKETAPCMLCTFYCSGCAPLAP
jgi:hypothetical protein